MDSVENEYKNNIYKLREKNTDEPCHGKEEEAVEPVFHQLTCSMTCEHRMHLVQKQST